MSDGETVDVRLARLEEQSKAAIATAAEARAARADLNDAVEILHTTLVTLTADTHHLEALVGRIEEGQQWLSRLIIGSIAGTVLTVLTAAAVVAATGHLK